ncbi:MAG: toxic anion resistance protein [Eubacteriaceae bacterium]
MAFSMEVTNVEEVKNNVIEQVKPKSDEVIKLEMTAKQNIAEIIDLDIDSLSKRKEILQSIESFGTSSMKNSASKNTLLQTTVGNLSKTGDEGNIVANGLMELHREIKDLDPSMIDFTKTGLFGKIFNPIRSYFAKYQKADGAIADIVESLDKGKNVLKNDNTTLEIEQQSLRELTKKLMKEIQLGILMDETLEKEIQLIEANMEQDEKVKFMKEEILFPLRQRLMDMQQMIAVNQQGIMAIEVVIRNNKELIRGVERAKNVTVSALKISVTVASALYNQKIVLKKIQLLNETTNNIISSTSKMLKEQGQEIHKQSIESNISVETLKVAFEDVISTLDSISTYKQAALPQMKNTIQQFKELADMGEQQIQKLEKGHNLVI